MSESRREARGARRETENGRPVRRSLGEGGFDDAIDLAVREMLDVEPPPGLRGRVLDGIEASTNPVASAFRRKIFWVAGPLATAAVIILAVLVPWQSAPPASVTPASPAIARVEPPSVVAPPTSPKIVDERGTRTMPLPRSTRPAERRPSPRAVEERIVLAAVAAVVEGGTVIDPLAPIAPIVAAGTHPADIVPTDIAISPMAPIAQLQIAPLSPPERRN